MADNKNEQFSVSTSLISMFDENSNQLRLAGMESGMSIAIWVPQVSPEGKMTFPQQSRFNTILSSDTVGSLDWLIKNRIVPDWQAGKDFKYGVPANRSMTAMIDIIGISGDIYEAAKIDGASDTRVMFSIVIPLLKPIIVFTIVQSSIGMFNLFTEPFILTNSSWTGGVNNGGLTLMMYLLNKAPQGGNSYGYASACAYVITIMIVIISVFVNKFSEEKDEGRRKYGK